MTDEQLLITHARRFGSDCLVKKGSTGWVVAYRALGIPKVFSTRREARIAACTWVHEKERRLRIQAVSIK